MLSSPHPASTRARAQSTRPLAILFDLDGTLIDSIELILNSARYAFSGHRGRVPSDSEWLAGVGMPLEAMFRQFVHGDPDVAGLIGRYREYQMANHDRLVRGYDQLVETVDGLHAAGHPFAVVTSKATNLARRGLDHVGLAHHFDLIVGCDICERHKPDPLPVHMALDRLGYEPSNAVFVGDSTHDMIAGNAAGVITIAALWGPFSREDLAATKPARFLARLADLPALVEELSTRPTSDS